MIYAYAVNIKFNFDLPKGTAALVAQIAYQAT
jgi:hypothetical protein